MKWSTLILIVIVLVSVVGIAFFVFPWEWADDVQKGWDCADTSYVYKKSQTVNIETWYDPNIPARQRRIVYEPLSADAKDWHFFDIGFAVQKMTAQDLRAEVYYWYDLGGLSHETWHWFDCTICKTQGECP